MDMGKNIAPAALEPPSRNAEIEVLRCLAILFTLLAHVPVVLPDGKGWREAIGPTVGFWTGVDLFFVVSGFVIMNSLRPLLARRDAGERIGRELAGFWVKRAFRLLPTAWFWLAFLLVLSFVLAPSGLSPPFGLMWRGSLTAMLNVDNLAGAWCVAGQSDSLMCMSRLLSGHYWSLSLEEQFYIVLPLVILLWPRRLFVPLVVCGIVGCIFLPRPIFSYAWFFRVDGFLWGILIALACEWRWHARLEPRLLRRWPLRAIVALALVYALARVPVAWAGLGFDFVGPHRSYAMSGVAAVGAMLVWLASWDRGYLFGKGAWLRPLVMIGSRSYSVYVIHLPLFLILHFAALKLKPAWPGLGFDVALVLLAVAMTFGLAELNFRWIETPLRARGRALAASIIGAGTPAGTAKIGAGTAG